MPFRLGLDSKSRRYSITLASDVLDSFVDYKFYVAGGVANLALVSLQAFDPDGNPVPGVSVEVVPGR